MNNKISRTYEYSDLDLDFLPHPTTGDVMRKTGENAIKRSVRNLILTNFYDRLFQPTLGGHAQALLFENATPVVKNLLEEAVYNTLQLHEPRIRVEAITADFDYDANGYRLTIEYVILNTNFPSKANLFLERLR